MDINIKMSKRQRAFCAATADEVLFGGAAGGGKSYGQILDAMLYALKYKGSKQLILRRTYPELDKSIIRVSLEVYPAKLYSYNKGNHTGTWVNGSIIDYGYCDNEDDVYKYQSAEYDCIRFDELTHFSEQMYIYLISRLRGANSYPKQVKSSTNPGGVGHTWVKDRFIDHGEPDVIQEHDNGTRIFLPSRVQDNRFLLDADPNYIVRLNNLCDKDKRALLYGDWDIFDGQYFAEFDRKIHVIEPFALPDHWRRYFAMDYGLDMLAGYWIAVDTYGRAYVYKEIYESNLIISQAAERIKAMTTEQVYSHIAPPDLWNRRQDTGKSVADIFAEYGIYLQRAQNDRVQGWYNLKEWLRPTQDEQGQTIANLRIFSTCHNLIRTLPAVQYDKRNPNDCATEPHELTHAPDAIRYFVAGRPMQVTKPARDNYDAQIQSFLSYGG